MTFLSRLRSAVLLSLVLAAATNVPAQHVLIGEDNGKPVVVRSVERHRAMYEKDGKRRQTSSSRFGLKKVEEYAPFYISVRNLKVTSSHATMMDSGAEINRGLQFRADFESPYRLENVFLVLDMKSENVGKSLFLWEIGTLRPRDPKSISLNVPVVETLGSGNFRLHLFVDGLEVFHSNMPFTLMQQALDQMVGRRTKGVTDAAPKPFVGPAPEYPPALRKAKTKGEAVIKFTLSPKGSVLDPVVKSATDPAFGESALAAARQWRFLPKIVASRGVTTPVEMPFIFTPTLEMESAAR